MARLLRRVHGLPPVRPALRHRALAVLLFLAVGAAAVPGAASAQPPTHTLLFTLRGEVREPGHVPVPPPEGNLEDACGVAVDSHGDLYVSDYYHGVVDVFGPGREYLTQILDAEPGGPCNLAVDAAGDVFVNQWRGRVLEFAPAVFPPVEGTRYGVGVPIDPSRTARATGIAIDPASGDLYVDEGSYVARYQAPFGPTAEPVAEIGLGSLGPGEGDGFGLALSSYPATAGDLYVADAAARTVKVYDPAVEPASPVEEFDGAGTPQEGFADLTDSALAVDPTDGHVFVTDLLAPFAQRPAAVVDEFNAQGAFRGPLPQELVDARPSAIAVDAAGGVYVTSGNSEGAVLYGFGPTLPAHSLIVSRAGGGTGTVISEPAGIDCGAACSAEYDGGEEVALRPAPATHSSFAGWSVAGRPGACTGFSRCKLTMSADLEVTASFEAIPQQTLTVEVTGAGTGEVTSAPLGIACPTGTCSAHFDAEGPEGTVTLTAAPAPHTAVSWAGCDSEPAATECVVAMDRARSVTVGFAPVRHVLTVIESGSGGGTVSSAPAGISCGSACAGTFLEGTTIGLTAQPASGSRFLGWSGGGCSGTHACQVTLGADTAVQATFVAAHDNLSVVREGSGQGVVTSEPAGAIACGQVCAGRFPVGSHLTLDAEPLHGSRFVGWSGCESAAGGRCVVTLSGEVAVTATFASLPTPSHRRHRIQHRRRRHHHRAHARHRRGGRK